MICEPKEADTYMVFIPCTLVNRIRSILVISTYLSSDRKWIGDQANAYVRSLTMYNALTISLSLFIPYM